MAENASLELDARTEQGSRAMRRLRRSGSVPGVIYGGDGEPVPFAVDARILRNTLAHAGAVLEVTIGGARPSPSWSRSSSATPCAATSCTRTCCGST